MAITNFVPEIWAASILESFKKATVFADVVNNDYEGEVANAGDTVRITSVGRPTISTYTPNSTTISYEEPNDAQRTLVVDQYKYWTLNVEDAERRQAKDGWVDAYTAEGAYALADTIDQYIAGLYTGVVSANALGATQVDTAAKSIENVLIPLKVKLDEANVPTEGRWVVVPPWFHGRLLGDNRFLDASASGSTEPLLNGRVGRAFGFDVRVSNNCPAGTGNNSIVICGTNQAITFATQIMPTVEAIRLETKLGDGVRCSTLYGAKLVRPYAIATCDASPD